MCSYIELFVNSLHGQSDYRLRRPLTPPQSSIYVIEVYIQDCCEGIHALSFDYSENSLTGVLCTVSDTLVLLLTIQTQTCLFEVKNEVQTAFKKRKSCFQSLYCLSSFIKKI